MAISNPVHPGDFIKSEIIEAHGLSVTAAAKVLGVSRPALSNLLNQNADLSGEMSLRIEKAFGVNMDTLMRMQARMLARYASGGTSPTPRTPEPFSARRRRRRGSRFFMPLSATTATSIQ